MTDVDWQSVSRAAAATRATEPFFLWIAGPVERTDDSFRECVCELGVSRASELPRVHGTTGHYTRKLRAIVDSGCTNTSIRIDIAAELGLQPVGIVQVHTGSSGADAIECQTVMADVRLVDPAGREILTRFELTAMDMADEMLLGMDLLTGGVLNIDLIVGVWDWKHYRPAGPPGRMAAQSVRTKPLA